MVLQKEGIKEQIVISFSNTQVPDRLVELSIGAMKKKIAKPTKEETKKSSDGAPKKEKQEPKRFTPFKNLPVAQGQPNPHEILDKRGLVKDDGLKRSLFKTVLVAKKIGEPASDLATLMSQLKETLSKHKEKVNYYNVFEFYDL